MTVHTEAYERLGAALLAETRRRGIQPYRMLENPTPRGRGQWRITLLSRGLDEALRAMGASQTIDLVETVRSGESNDSLRAQKLQALALDDLGTAVDVLKSVLQPYMEREEERLRACRLLGLPDVGVQGESTDHLSIDRWVLRRGGARFGIQPRAMAAAIMKATVDDSRTFATHTERVRFHFSLLWIDDQPVLLAKPYVPLSTASWFNGEDLVIEGAMPPVTALQASVGHPLGRIASTGTGLEERIVKSWSETEDGDLALQVEPDPVPIARFH